jgi:hypothetical protein
MDEEAKIIIDAEAKYLNCYCAFDYYLPNFHHHLQLLPPRIFD